ncbi:MAG TPA: VTT domain-containing protein [Thermoanaerobaculia bacterium]|nr:VTT domain-containing protein [Thermoanaerobaculia bacterium]
MSSLLPYLTLFLTMVAQVVVPPIPAELIVILAGRRYGVVNATAVAGAGLFTGSVLVFHFSRFLQQRFERLFRRDRVERVVARLREYSTPILWIRILPYNPSDVISYAAGLIGVPPRRFYAITACTSLARCLALAVLGLHVEDLRTAFQVLGLLALSSLVAWAVLHRRRGARG